MRTAFCLAFGLAFNTALIVLGADKPHRAIVVSTTDDRRSAEPCEVRLIETETARVLATAQVGNTATVALSPNGAVLAVVSRYSIANISQPRARLELYRTDDLSLVNRGYLPVHTSTFKRIPSKVTMQFSPDGKEILLQRMDAYDAVLSRVKLELDEAGVFRTVGQSVSIAGARAVDFLRIDWPQVTVNGSVDGKIHVLDLEDGSHLSENRLDPLADVPNDLPRRHGTGTVVTADGKYGYYVPQQPGLPRYMRHVGHLQRLDLASSPPKVIQVSPHAQPNLRARVAAVSEMAGALVVAEQRYSEVLQAPSPRVTFFHTLTLTPARQIELSLTNCDSLAISADGKYLYAVDFGGRMSVVEVATGDEVTTLADVGEHPALVLALP